jgi:MFS family permease
MPSLSFNILRSRDFRLLMLGRTMVIMALQAQAVIVGWQMYVLTGDPFMLGLTGIAEAIPAIGCAFFAGHIIDISRPHRVYVVCLFLLLLNALMLFLYGGGFVLVAHGTLVLVLFLGVFISGVVRSFAIPSSFALFPQIVPTSETLAASAWMSSGFQLACIIGPAVAGLIYGGYGVREAWFLPLGLTFISFVMIAGMGRTHRRYRSLVKHDSMVKSVWLGWKFIFKHPVILSVMSLDMFAVMFGGAVAMLPAYADQVLHVGSEGLGILRAAPAIGAVIIAVALAIRPLRYIRGTTLLWVVAGFGVCIIGFGLSKVFWLSMVFLLLSGAFDGVSVVIRSTVMQLLTPDAMRGRVSSVSHMFISSSNEIGAFESGLAARFLGLVPSVVFGGIGCILVVAVAALTSTGLRQLVLDTKGHKEK